MRDKLSRLLLLHQLIICPDNLLRPYLRDAVRLIVMPAAAIHKILRIGALINAMLGAQDTRSCLPRREPRIKADIPGHDFLAILRLLNRRDHWDYGRNARGGGKSGSERHRLPVHEASGRRQSASRLP